MEAAVYHDGTEKWVCAYCEQYTDEDKRKVNAHQMQCSARKEEAPFQNELEAPEPEVEPEETPAQIRAQEIRQRREDFGDPRQSHKPFPDDGFQYRIFNDNWRVRPNRIKDAEANGWEAVEGESKMHRGTNEDGSSIEGVVMRIPEEIYEEDFKASQKEVDLVDEAIGRGTLEQQAGDNRYIPDGIRIHSNTQEP